MMSGNATPSQMGALPDGAARCAARPSRRSPARHARCAPRRCRSSAPPGAIDTVGTGGDGAGTFNISTAAAIVVAGAGVPVAKHGNRNFSSKIRRRRRAASARRQPRCRRRRWCSGRCAKPISGFLMAPRHHSAMRHVGPTRVELGTRTIFNLLGPLSNPAGAKRQLVGVFAAAWVKPVAEVLGKLGSERAWVVHGRRARRAHHCRHQLSSPSSRTARSKLSR